MDQWTLQGKGVVKEVEINSSRDTQLLTEKRARPYKEQQLNCPRCNSLNTKFCYYNNYSLSQPRYFCKTCRRYWTEGGSLRNVPVGGGSRKNKRPSSSSLTSSSSSTTTSLMVSSCSTNRQVQIPTANSKLYEGQGQDLNLSFQTPNLPTSGSISALEMIRTMAPASFYGSQFGFQELMRQSNIKLPFCQHDGFNGSIHQMQEEGVGRVLFPFEDLNHVSNGGNEELSNEVVNGNEDPGLFWNGGSGGGGGGW